MLNLTSTLRLIVIVNFIPVSRHRYFAIPQSYGEGSIIRPSVGGKRPALFHFDEVNHTTAEAKIWCNHAASRSFGS